jgi:hypothetical protein
MYEGTDGITFRGPLPYVAGKAAEEKFIILAEKKE